MHVDMAVRVYSLYGLINIQDDLGSGRDIWEYAAL